ncbi:MAG: hypothetical protein RIB69_12000 [Roseovarius sp.]
MTIQRQMRMQIMQTPTRGKRMRLRGKIPTFLVAGLVVTATASGGTYFYVKSLEQDLREARAEIARLSEVETLSIPVLARDVAQGTILDADAFTTVKISADHLPDDVVVDLAQAMSVADGKLSAAHDLQADSFLLLSQLTRPQTISSAGVMVPFGYAAIAVSAANADEFAQPFSPGDRVDILWRMTDEGQGGETHTRLIGSNLSVAQLHDQPAEEPGASTNDTAAPAEAANPRGEAEKDKIVLVGPASEIALLVQSEGRGEHFVLPANSSVVSGGRNESYDDESLTSRPVVEMDDAGAQESEPARTSDAPSDSEPPSQWERVSLPLEFSPKRCQLMVVRSASRSMVEVPC